jgi:hypothetical protein
MNSNYWRRNTIKAVGRESTPLVGVCQSGAGAARQPRRPARWGSNLKAQASKLCRRGCAEVSRSTQARVNEQQPASLCEALLGTLLAQFHGPGHERPFPF